MLSSARATVCYRTYREASPTYITHLRQLRGLEVGVRDAWISLGAHE